MFFVCLFEPNSHQEPSWVGVFFLRVDTYKVAQAMGKALRQSESVCYSTTRLCAPIHVFALLVHLPGDLFAFCLPVEIPFIFQISTPVLPSLQATPDQEPVSPTSLHSRGAVITSILVQSTSQLPVVCGLVSHTTPPCSEGRGCATLFLSPDLTL